MREVRPHVAQARGGTSAFIIKIVEKFLATPGARRYLTNRT
jgi:hypothetical protein